MELNIKVWKPKPKLKNQERQFLIVNDQWLIDNADLLRNGGFEIDETFHPIKEGIQISNDGNDINATTSENSLFEFDKEENKEVVKPKKSKQ